jgi:hypothetical protein
MPLITNEAINVWMLLDDLWPVVGKAIVAHDEHFRILRHLLFTLLGGAIDDHNILLCKVRPEEDLITVFAEECLWHCPDRPDCLLVPKEPDIDTGGCCFSYSWIGEVPTARGRHIEGEVCDLIVAQC